MSKKIVSVIMLGMNRFSGRDTAHSFDMSHMKNYNTIWLPHISIKEKTCSTPIYEISKTIDTFRNKSNENNSEANQIVKDNVLFIIGRGTFGDKSEKHLAEAVLEARKTFGPDAYFMLYAKSFGVVDTLRALKIVQKNNVNLNIDLMYCIDGYATPRSKNSVSKRRRRERRLNYPTNVKKVFNIVQRKKGFKGLRMGSCEKVRAQNFTVSKKDITTEYYTAYSDGYKRKLDISHHNMEEIVSTIPCCKLKDDLYTVNDALNICLKKYVGEK